MDLACLESRLQPQGTILLRGNSKQTSLAAQWLKLHPSYAGSPGSIFLLGTKIPCTSSALPKKKKKRRSKPRLGKGGRSLMGKGHSQEGRSTLAYSRKSEGPGMTWAELDTKKVEGDHTAPRAVEGFQLPFFACLLWLRLCF